MSTIPASTLVNVTPGVLSAGGNAINLNGLFLSPSTRTPIGQVLSFPTAAAVSTYYGSTSPEAVRAGVYFAGFDNSSVKPGALLITQYPQTAVAAYLRGANLSGLSLTQLQALSGNLSVTVNGSLTSATISLAAATSFAGAAAIIEQTTGLIGIQQGAGTAQAGAAFIATGTGTQLTVSAVNNGFISIGDTLTGTGIPGNTTIVAQISGTIGGVGVYTTSNPTTVSGSLVVSLSLVMNLTSLSSGTVTLGDRVIGTGVAAEQFVLTQLSGTTGGVGHYSLSFAQYFFSQSVTINVPGVQFDPIANAFVINSSTTGSGSTITYASGSLSSALLLTQALGAVLSQGANAATPSAFMTSVVAIIQNWATFVLLFDPDNGAVGGANKLLFAQWTSQQNNRYVYIATDTDASPTVSAPALPSFGQQIIAAGYSGTVVNWEPAGLGEHLSEFLSGAIASLNFNQQGGRATMAYRSQSGLAIGVTNATVAANLLANGYNFYGAYATANQQFLFYQNGAISGPFVWTDSFVNQIWMNANFQSNLMVMLANSLSVPYNAAGYALIEASLGSTINAALNFGAIRSGVPLSPLQIAEVNGAAGTKIDQILSTRGWYLQVVPATPQVRQARQSPTCNFWYMDGQSVQLINLASVELQ